MLVFEIKKSITNEILQCTISCLEITLYWIANFINGSSNV